jgi:hypothetical protein
MPYRYDAQGYPGGFHRFPEGKYGNIRAEGFPTPTYRLSPCETASWKPSSLSSNELFIMRDTGFNTRCMGYDGSTNGFLNFPTGSNRMLPPTKPSITWDNQQLKGNDDLSCMSMQVAMGSSPPMFDFQIHLAPEEAVQSRFPVFPSLDDIGCLNGSFSIPVNDPLSLNPAGCHPSIP